MSKLTGVTGLSRRNKDNTQSSKMEDKKITTVSTRRNVTTTTSPVPIRLTENDKAELSIWLEELQSMTGKKITTAKLVRGLIHMREKINGKKLIEAIKDAS